MAIQITFLALVTTALLATAAALKTSHGTSQDHSSVPRAMRLYVQVRGAEYPCGEMQKAVAFEPYRNTLLQKVCPSSKPGCAVALECLLNEFYTADCDGMNQVQDDVCEVCTADVARGNASAVSSASEAEGSGFHEYKQFFRSEYQLYRKLEDADSLGHELACAAMMMVKDQCARGAQAPSCNTNVEAAPAEAAERQSTATLGAAGK